MAEHARTSLDRFNQIWHHPKLQERLSSHWYQDVKEIDTELYNLADKLAQKHSAMVPSGDAEMVDTYRRMKHLALTRETLKPVYTTRARNTSSKKQAAGARTYAESIKAACDACIAVGMNDATSSAVLPKSVFTVLQRSVRNCNVRNGSSTVVIDRPIDNQDGPTEAIVKRHEKKGAKKASTSKKKIYCICRKGERGEMLQCGPCGEWFHYDCVNVTSEMLDALNGNCWTCPACVPATF